MSKWKTTDRLWGVNIRNIGTGKRPWMMDVMRGGRRIRRCYETEEAAKSAAAELANGFVERGVQGQNLTAEQRVDAERALALLGGRVSLEDAARAILGQMQRRQETVENLAAQLMENREAAGRREKTLRTLRGKLEVLSKKFGPRPIGDIQYGELEKWLVGMKGKKGVTRNGYRQAAVSLWEYAIAHDCAVVNIAKRLPKASRDEELPAIFTLPEARRLLRSASKVWGGKMLAYFAIGMFAGLRPERELAGTRWENIDLEDGTIRVMPDIAKRRRMRFVRIEKTLAAWLERCPERTGRIFYSRRCWRKVIEDAKVEWREDIMRHSFASYMLARDGDAAKVSRELGHSESSEVLFNHYRNLVKEKEGREYFEISPECPGQARRGQPRKGQNTSRPPSGRPGNRRRSSRNA